MRKLTLFLTLIFSLMFSSSTSFAEWKKVGENAIATFYVDFESIRKHDGYVYYWRLSDWLKPIKGDLSYKIHEQADCKKFRYKWLSFSSYQEPMGGGTGETLNAPDKEWRYPLPDSAFETILKSVCQYVR